MPVIANINFLYKKGVSQLYFLKYTITAPVIHDKT